MFDIANLQAVTKDQVAAIQSQIDDLYLITEAFAYYIEQNESGVDEGEVFEPAGNFDGASDYITRNLDRIHIDFGEHGTILNNNLILLPANSTYIIEWSCPAMWCQQHQSRLYDVTSSSVLAEGTNEYADTNEALSGSQARTLTRSTGSAVITTTSAMVIRLEHRAPAASDANYTKGWTVNFADSVHSTLLIRRVAQ